MALRDVPNRWFGRGAAPPCEQGERLVEIAVVALHRGPMLVQEFIEAGFDATGTEAFNIVTKVRSDFSISVPSSQSDAALAFLE